jgi:hypothetical protein
MPIATVMAESTPIEERDPGAPIARDQIDPELIKLARARPQIGIITAAGIVALCVVFLVRLSPDRRFAASGAPVSASLADVLSGQADLDRLVTVAAEPVVSHAIRATKAEGTQGLRVVPARNSGERLWIAVTGDAIAQATPAAYVGRLRKLDDLTFAGAVRAYAAAHPRPVFATAAAMRAGFSAGTVATVSGDSVAIADSDRIAIDVVDPNAATIAAAFHDRLPDVAAWSAALTAAGITATAASPPDTALGLIRFAVALPVTTTTTRLEAARLFAARVEPVTRHYGTTWAALRTSPPAGLDLGTATLPDAQLELLGVYVSRRIPADAYALVTGELPDDYWYVAPITVALAGLLLVFAWALVRAIRRDLMPARAA